MNTTHDRQAIVLMEVTMNRWINFRVTCALMSEKQVGMIESDCGHVWVLLTLAWREICSKGGTSEPIF